MNAVKMWCYIDGVAWKNNRIF